MESTERQPHARGYGQACAQCRMKKRRCKPTGVERCEWCDKDGERCIFVGRKKRSRRSQLSTTNGASPLAKRVRGDEFSLEAFGDVPLNSQHQRQRDLPGNLLQTFEQHSSNDDSMSFTLLALADERLGAPQTSSTALQFPSALASGSNLMRDAESPEASVDPYLVDPSVTQVEHSHGNRESTLYTTAMSTFVDTVCGDVRHFEIDEELLSLYFTWFANQHNAVIERLFRRDMARSPPGPYFSPALLYAIYAQASRITQPPDRGQSYTEKAQALCIASISEPPSIPIIQTLLELAGKELATGQGSKGWLFGGMALRMVTDMGLHNCVKQRMEDRRTTEEREDLEVRTRLFWSAYCWDKFYALTMGRQPMLAFPYGDVDGPVPLTLAQLSNWGTTPLNSSGRDQAPTSAASAATARWLPLYLPAQQKYPYTPQPFLATETLHASCLLYREIEEIIRRLYQTMSLDTESVEHRAWMDKMTARLIKWRSQVAPGVLLDTSYLPTTSPPPHVLSVNILYRTAWILLKRPRGESGRSQAEFNNPQSLCAERSGEIHALFKLHERSFGLQNLTYLMAYMAYVSATVDINEALDPDLYRAMAGTMRLTFTLQILTQAAIHTPGIRRSISHLRRRIAGQTGSTHSHGRRLESRTTAHPMFHGGTMETRASSPVRVLDATEEQSASPTADLPNIPTALELEELFATLLPDQGASSWLGDLGGVTQGQDGNDVRDWFDTTWT